MSIIRHIVVPERPYLLTKGGVATTDLSLVYDERCMITGYRTQSPLLVETDGYLYIAALFRLPNGDSTRGVIQYDKTSRQFSTVDLQTVADIRDKHFSPSLYVGTGERVSLVAAWWSGAVDTVESHEYISMWVSNSAEDITAWGSEIQIGFDPSNQVATYPSIVVTPVRSMVFTRMTDASMNHKYSFRVASNYPFALLDLGSSRDFIPSAARYHIIRAKQDTVSPNIVHFFSRDHSGVFNTDGRGYYFWADFNSGKFKGVLPDIGDMTNGSELPMRPLNNSGDLPNGSPKNDAGFEWFPIDTDDWIVPSNPLTRGELGGSTPVFVPFVERNGAVYDLKVLRIGRDFYSMNLASANSQYVDLTTLGNFGQGMHNYTWEVWFKTETLTRMSFASTFNDGSSTNFVSQLNSLTNAAESAGSFYHQLRNDVGTSRTKASNTNEGHNNGEWCKYAVRVAAGEITHMRVNSSPVIGPATGSIPADNFSNLQYPLLLGGFNNRGTINQRFWNGKLAFPALYSVAKDPTDLTDVDKWQRLPDPNDPDLFAAWFFREGSGSTVADEKGNHTGTLQAGSGTLGGMWDTDIPPIIDSEKIDLGIEVDDFNLESIQNAAGTEYKIIFTQSGKIKELVTTDDFETWTVSELGNDNPTTRGLIATKDGSDIPLTRQHGTTSFPNDFCLELEQVDI